VAPGDLATIYNLNPLFSAGISGQGQTIVVIEDTDVYTTDDWVHSAPCLAFRHTPNGSFTQIHPAPPTGTNNCSDPGVNGDDGEAILDAEYASAAAPSAAIELASCTNTVTFGGLIALENLLNDEQHTASAREHQLWRVRSSKRRIVQCSLQLNLPAGSH
jgi:subtilase family serine protease